MFAAIFALGVVLAGSAYVGETRHAAARAQNAELMESPLDDMPPFIHDDADD